MNRSGQLIWTILCFPVLFSCGVHRLEKKGYYRELDAQTYATASTQQGIQLIDVRTPSEYERSHLTNAINISYFGGFKKSLKRAALNPELPTYIYCETQHRSLFATKVLFRQGFKNIVDLDEGMGAYRKKGLPFVVN